MERFFVALVVVAVAAAAAVEVVAAAAVPGELQVQEPLDVWLPTHPPGALPTEIVRGLRGGFQLVRLQVLMISKPR